MIERYSDFIFFWWPVIILPVKRLLVLQHVAHEILGTLDPLLKRAGFRIRYINFSRHPDAQPSVDGYDGLVILGGPMSVDDSDRLPHLVTEMHLIEQAMKRDLPVLGICLGAQLIAKTLGAAVYPNREKEIGWYDVAPSDDAKKQTFFRARGGGGKRNRLVRCGANRRCKRRSFARRLGAGRKNIPVAW